MAKHRRQPSRANGTKIVGVAGMVGAAATLALTAGAGTAQAKPHGFGFGFGGLGGNNSSSSPAAAAPAAAAPAATPSRTINLLSGFNIPNYGNIPGQAAQAGLGTAVPGCGNCYVGNSTGLFAQPGSTVTVNGTPTTVPATPTNDIPAVTSSTGTQILLPTPKWSPFNIG